MNITSQLTPIGPGNMNEDGMADILWRDALGNLHAWLMNGASKPRIIQLSQPTPGWEAIDVGDYDGDGVADILWTHRPTGERRITNIGAPTGAAN